MADSTRDQSKRKTIAEPLTILAIALAVLFVTGFLLYRMWLPGPMKSDSLLWRVPADCLNGPAVVDNDRVFFSGKDSLYSVDAETGDKKWVFTSSAGVDSPPAVGDGKVYCGIDYGHVAALDAKTGKEIWSVKLDNTVSTVPVYSEGGLFFLCDDGYLYSFDSNNGEQRWRTSAEGASAAPAVSGGRLYCAGSEEILALDARTGANVWAFPLSGSTYYSPAIGNNFVYCGCFDRSIFALNADTGTELWRHRVTGNLHDSPAFANDMLLIGSVEKGGIITALDALTGAEKWQYSSEDAACSYPVIAGNTVYCGSTDLAETPEMERTGGFFFALNADTGTELWKMSLVGRGGLIPTVSDRAVFCAQSDGFNDETFLYAIKRD